LQVALYQVSYLFFFYNDDGVYVLTGVGAITTPATQFSSTGGASNNMNVRVHLD